MRRWLTISAALLLSACANSGYRYHEAGYWTAAREPSRSWLWSASFAGCLGWGGPLGYAAYGYVWSPCGYGYGAWYGAGYWRDPYWSQRWYLPRTPESRIAGARARALAGGALESTEFPRFEDLAPTRSRDLGGGDRRWGSTAQPGRWTTVGARGVGSAQYGTSRGLSSAASSARDSSSVRSAGMSSFSHAGAGAAARSSSRDNREEE